MDQIAEWVSLGTNYQIRRSDRQNLFEGKDKVGFFFSMKSTDIWLKGIPENGEIKKREDVTFEQLMEKISRNFKK